MTQAMRSMLFGVNASDLISFVSATAAMVIVVAIASFLPARRAAVVDPALTLRAE